MANQETERREFMMGRLQIDTLDRVECFCDRVLDVVAEIERQHVSRRILDQMTGAGTAVGANLYEADEAMSRKDFVKCLCIANKELNETRFWVRLVGRRGWVNSTRLSPLLEEINELRRVLGSIITKTSAAEQTARTI